MATRIPSWRSDRRSAAARGYGSKWRKARDIYLQSNPLCVYCQADGIITAANVVDHKIPHKGDQVLFWDQDNWQAMCREHHDSTKAKEEYRGARIGGDESGQPLDRSSHWYK